MVLTDHKPLETILRKLMTAAPLRLQAVILKVSGYDLKVKYLPGKRQILADTLSRASLNEEPLEEDEIQVEMLERISISEPSMQNFSKTQGTRSMSCTPLFKPGGQPQNNMSHTASGSTGTLVMSWQLWMV